jgi:hypothetical protein
MVQPKNGRLYRTVVNRVWAQVMGRGIVEPVDMMDNDPWSQDLLDWLAADFVANGHDIKRLIGMILTSKTYQLPSVGVKEAELVMSPQFRIWRYGTPSPHGRTVCRCGKPGVQPDLRRYVYCGEAVSCPA